MHKKLSVILTNLEGEISRKVDDAVKSNQSEKDLRWYLWLENVNDISRTENKHLGSDERFERLLSCVARFFVCFCSQDYQ